MKKLFSLTSRLFAVTLIFSMVAFSTACNDDDEVDCDKLENQMDDLEDEYDEAWSDGDCEKIEDVYNDLLALLKKGKSCDFVDDLIDDSGAEDFNELIDFLEDIRDEEVNECENPPL